MNRRKPRPNALGFTLIELMVVVGIIGILAAIAIPRFVRFTLRARQAEAYTNAQVIKNAQYSYWAVNDCFADTQSHPPLAPSGQRQDWGSVVPTPGFTPCAAVANMEDFGFRPNTGAVYFRYECDATPAVPPNPAEFSCSIDGDLDDDLAPFELIFCSDYGGNGAGMPSPAFGSACNIPFEWYRVSAGIY